MEKLKNNIYTYSRDLNYLFFIHSDDNTNTSKNNWFPNKDNIYKDISSIIKIYSKDISGSDISYKEDLSINNSINGLTPVFYNYNEDNQLLYSYKIKSSLYNIFVNEDSLLNVRHSSIMDNCINIVTTQGLGYISDNLINRNYNSENYNKPYPTLRKNYVNNTQDDTGTLYDNNTELTIYNIDKSDFFQCYMVLNCIHMIKFQKQ